MNQDKKVVKISDVVDNQIPEFLVSENPNFVEFLKQYYISQEFQGSNIDLAENLISYRNVDAFNNENLIASTTLTEDIDFFDDQIFVESTKGWPKEYGLLKIDNEIITYTGITTNSFTGCIRGFSGVDSLSVENNPEYLNFSTSESDSHSSIESDGTSKLVINLSNLFLQEFFKKIKYQFAPGFEELNFDENINSQNFISKVKTFYQSKGTDEAYQILFKVLFNKDVQILKPQDFCFTTSDDQWVVTETFLCELVSGNPTEIKGQTLYQDKFENESILEANGSIYEVEEYPINGNVFYNIKVFAGYSNNLNPKGSISGTFVPTSKTFLADSVDPGASEIFVDSTIGFASSGKLSIGDNVVTYTDKTNDQFLNCTGVSNAVSRGSKVFSDNFVYSYENGEISKVVKFRIHNVLSSIQSSDISYSYHGDPIKITDIGNPENSTFVSSLYYNHPINVPAGIATSQLTANIRNFVGEGFDVTSGLVLTKYDHNLRSGDIVDLYDTSTNNLVAANLIVNAPLEKEFSVQPITEPSILGKNLFFRRRIKKTKSPANIIESISGKFVSNIQDSFSDSENYYITSNGLPDYEINPYKREFNFTTDLTQLNASHNFYSGELVTVVDYTTSGNFRNDVGISTGVSFYVLRINSNIISVSESRDNLELNSFINFTEYDINGVYSGKVDTIKLISAPLYSGEFTTSKLFKKIPKKLKFPANKVKTNPGPIGIFANGVEIQNYKSFDKIYYGKINSITVLNGGENYSLINPPKFEIFDGNVKDNDTVLYPELIGKLKRLDVVDPGFDYIETPTITVSGGNNYEVVTEVKMKSVSNIVSFNSTTKDNVVSTATDSFIFDNLHRFNTGEPVVYKTFGTRPIGIGTLSTSGTLLDGSVYYIINSDDGLSFRLSKTKEDALANNYLRIRTNGGGINEFISLEKRNCIDEVLIIKNDKNFYYKSLSVGSDGINIDDDVITIENHGFETGEEIRVFVDTNPGQYSGYYPGGIEENKRYYIVKLDENRFKLSSTKNKVTYVDITSVDVNTSVFFEYYPIRVEIKGNLSYSGISTTGYHANIVPVIEGSVVSVRTRQGGDDPPKNNIGSKEIINYNKYPTISQVEGFGCIIDVLVVDGRINQAIVKTQGVNYFNNFEIIVEGSGYGAKLSPVIVDGKVVDVKIVNSGVGYSQNTTSVKLIPLGINLKLRANLQTWTINEISKLGYSNIESGSLFGKKYSLFGNVFGTFFLNKDLRTVFNIPDTPTKHSPIVGWAYDGCPIYGPFGFTNPDGTGGILRMRSGYSKNKISPPINFDCIEDYVFTNSGTLDKHNGRYCVTPEYPNGVYAYFCTLDVNNTPEFPYVIGDEYNYSPQKENFDLKHNQTINFNTLGIDKCTKPYRMDDKKTGYEYFNFLQSGLTRDGVIIDSTSGTVDEILISDSGNNYEIGDAVIFDNSGTGGYGVSAEVSEISGVEIDTITSSQSTLNNLTFVSDGDRIVAISTEPHNLQTDYYITVSGISTTDFQNLNGFKKITVEDISVGLSTYFPDSTTTGLVTSISIKESILSFKVDSKIQIENEVLTVIGIDYRNNLINVARESGSPAHLPNTKVNLLQNEFIFENPEKYILPEENISYYFNSSESVSVGLDTTSGSGNTLTISPLGFGVSETKFVRTAGIFLPGHKFKNGEKIKYTPATSTIVSNLGNLDQINEIYIVNLEDNVVGLVTNKNHVTNLENLLYYSASGTGQDHKFTTDRSTVSGISTLINVTVSTASTHGLIKGDLVTLNVRSGITTEFVVSYQSANKRLLINSQANPRIDVYENDIVKFITTSPTLSNTDFNLYTDPEFQNTYFGTDESGIEVIKTGSDLVLRISDKTPKLLYYNIESLTKKSNSDLSVDGFNTLIVNKSSYNGSGKVISSTSNTFTLNYPRGLERPIYSSQTSNLTYSILSKGIKGPISKIKFNSNGNGYKKLPIFKSITSISGNGASLSPISKTIGKIKDLQILNTKSIYPSDRTLSPRSNVFSVLRLKDNLQVDNVDIISPGKNYLTAPLVKLYNRKEDKIIPSFIAVANLKDNYIDSVTILNSGFGLKSTDNQIVTTNHTNGIRVLGVSVSGSSSPYQVTLTLETPLVGFTTDNPLPISEGDKIFVEGIKSTLGNGYNSSDYKYDPFTVTFVDPAFSSPDAAIVRYELNEDPGIFVENASFDAKVINYDNIPQFNVSLVESEFSNFENISKATIIDNIKNSRITNLVKVSTPEDISVGDIVVGESSSSRGTVFKIDNFSTTFNVDSSVFEKVGWKGFRGNLSTILQKLPDNDYYQKFSYSLKSKEQFTNWNSIVSDLSHVSGYKKFADLIVESSVPVENADDLKITSNSLSQVNVNLQGYANVNTISGFDLVSEEDIDDNNGEYSEYLKFKSKKLSSFLLSSENRVLSIDDISGLFDNDTVPVVSIPIDTVSSSDVSVLKYVFFIASTTSFFGTFELPQLLEVFVTRNNFDVNLTSYAYYYSTDNNIVTLLGTINTDVSDTNSDQVVISFIPRSPFNSYAIRAIKEVAQSEVGISTQSIGYNRNVEITEEYASSVSPSTQVFYSIPLSECKSGSLFVGISSSPKKVGSSMEMIFTESNGDILSNIYSEQKTADLGSIGVNINGSDLEFTYDPLVGIAVTVHANLNLLVNTVTNPKSQLNELTKLESDLITFTGVGPEPISTISNEYAASKFTLEIKKTVGVTTQTCLVQLDSVHFGDYLNNTEYGFIGDLSLDEITFESTYDSGTGTYILTIQAEDSADYQVKFYQRSISNPN